MIESFYIIVTVINENIQTVNMWLSAEETSTLDNALVTMEHIYKTGIITIRLGRLINKPSYFQIEYSTAKREHRWILTISIQKSNKKIDHKM